ncbi:MAG: nucleotidyl transferase AbiEii/AbiGii toxin family protein [Christensenellaceae bacterium]|nr:nucleotidyl transferase AbiEii/AbiGii toxin family protein [Christensenellaceae bacterium]
MLHNEKELFEQLILRTSAAFGIEAGIIEKDYFVTLMLKKVVAKQPDIVFKGGTSLSKCYKLINRFSEDIDLNILCETRPSESQRKALNKMIISVVEDMGFSLKNPEEMRSKRDFNRYVVGFPSVFDDKYLKPDIIVETAVFLRAYPTERLNAASLIYDYLVENNLEDLINQYELEPFELNVQTADRTFVDKVFALCDYYLDNKIQEHSRHIYDLYKLLEVVQLNDQLKELIVAVRGERSQRKVCLSAKEEVNINLLLQEIIDKKVYKADYETITSALIYDEVSYSTAITALKEIIQKNIF